MIDGFIRASKGNWRPSSAGGGDNFVHVENLAAKLEARTDPLMVSPNVALRRANTGDYMGFEYSGESRVFLSVLVMLWTSTQFAFAPTISQGVACLYAS